jgi:hypothetical protein
MIHTTHRETLISCDMPHCVEHDWIAPTKHHGELYTWLLRNGWRSDGQRYFCACCAPRREVMS